MRREKVLGIIGCLALADELVELLSKDEEMERAFIVDNEEGRMVADKLGQMAPHLEVSMMEEDRLRLPSWLPGLSVVIWMRSGSLHDNPEELKNSLRMEAITLSGFVDSILMFYGLCRRTPREVERLVSDLDVPITLLTDLEGHVVDDCFAAIFGGRRRYREMIKEHKGTLFITTGYAEHWMHKQDGKDLVQIMDEVNSYQSLLKTLGYTKLLKLDTGLGDSEEFEVRANNMARIFDLNLERINCNLEVFHHSYSLAKEKLEGATGEEMSAPLELDDAQVYDARSPPP